MRLLMIACGFLLSTDLLAYQKTYSLQLTSSVSPAQYRTTSRSTGEGMFEYHKASVGDADISGFDFGGLFLHRNGKKLTFAGEFVRRSWEIDPGSFETTFIGLTPGASFSLMPNVVFGGALILGQTTSKIGDNEESETVFLPKVGGMYVARGMEVGLAFQPEDDDAFVASEIIFHGRKDIDRKIAAGGILKLLSINDNDAMEITALGEYNVKKIDVEGAFIFLNGDSVSFNSGTFSDGSVMTFKGGVKYALDRKSKVGGALSYGFISSDDDDGHLMRLLFTYAMGF